MDAEYKVLVNKDTNTQSTCWIFPHQLIKNYTHASVEWEQNIVYTNLHINQHCSICLIKSTVKHMSHVAHKGRSDRHFNQLLQSACGQDEALTNMTPSWVSSYLGVYALLDRLHVVTLSQSLPDTELRGEFWKLKKKQTNNQIKSEKGEIKNVNT